ncbi:OmpA family protein [Paragemmobacter ruber]|uniref:OmpA family protein n=1 Tax=Paragemmobacter ruber TaxID=1985673 RepID=A0ABW9Y9M9_9RHOB|nr:OmpA family protein [Rhodobacter ruber]NBE09233.1 OmpA family protein [Rhodobacter ruber]
MTAALLAVLTLATPALALDLRLPTTASPSGERHEALTSYNVPTGPWQAGTIPTTTAEGNFSQSAWKIPAADQTTLQILQPLRAQLADQGFTTVFECATAACGGFDFRYGTDILPEPQMHVDLGDFRFLAARRDGAGSSDWVTLIISRSADTGFVQMTRIGAEPVATPDMTLSSKSALAPGLPSVPPTAEPAALPQQDALTAALAAGQPATLSDLVFPSGRAELAPGDYPSLASLAAWLAANPAAQIELVGHTDASGNAQANTALSLARAEAARSALIARFGIDPARITTRGAGPAAPIATNDTAEGRAQNRRVEVITTPTL